MTQAITACYVFAQTPTGELCRAGKLQLGRTAGSFTYDTEWLTKDWTYPLDPVNLKLLQGAQTTRAANSVFPVFSDAGPDDWGTRVLLAGHKRLPLNEIERLVATSGHGVGCLQFSMSRSRPKTPSALPSISLLDDLEQASHKIAANESVDPALLEILVPATSMGGARPKVTLTDNGFPCLAKFSRAGDLFNVPRVEYASMQLARNCGIDIPDISIQQVGDRDVFLIKRFDRKTDRSLHYISAHSLFNRDRVRLYDDAFTDPCSYVALASILRAHGKDWKRDSEQLFRRIIFNVVIGNTDDHGRNHGLLYDPADPGWQLSPAFDLLPSLAPGREHALGIGRHGRTRSLENVRSAAVAFGLSSDHAESIIDQICDVTSDWQSAFAKSGANEHDITLLRQVIGRQSD